MSSSELTPRTQLPIGGDRNQRLSKKNGFYSAIQIIRKLNFSHSRTRTYTNRLVAYSRLCQLATSEYSVYNVYIIISFNYYVLHRGEKNKTLF